MGAGVGDQVVGHLAQAEVVAADDDRRGRVKLEPAIGLCRTGRFDRGGCHVTQIDGLLLERQALIEAGEQQQLVDELTHARALFLDAPHHVCEIFGPVGGTAAKQFGEAANRGDRGAELVRGVGDELAQPLLRRHALGKGLFDLRQHAVERPAEPPDLGAAVVGYDPLRKVAAGDRVGRCAHPLERPQLEARQPQSRSADREQEQRGHGHLDQQQAALSSRHVRQRKGHDHCAPLTERQCQQPEPGRAGESLGCDRIGITQDAANAAEIGWQARPRLRLLAVVEADVVDDAPLGVEQGSVHPGRHQVPTFHGCGPELLMLAARKESRRYRL